MRRLFIIRKDLHLTAGKLGAMVAHCAEGYWLRLIERNIKVEGDKVTASFEIEKEIYGRNVDSIYENFYPVKLRIKNNS